MLCFIDLPYTKFKVSLFLKRLTAGWDRQPEGMKKAWSFKDASAIHAATGGYMAIMQALKEKVPQADAAAQEPQLRQRFEASFLDDDIINFLSETVPPVDLHQVSFLRTARDACALSNSVQNQTSSSLDLTHEESDFDNPDRFVEPAIVKFLTSGSPKKTSVHTILAGGLEVFGCMKVYTHSF